MRAVVQRVAEASVEVDGRIVGAIGVGLVVLVGAVRGDDERSAVLLADKVADLRVFRDEHDRMNRSVSDVGGGVLVVSQFTLAADLRRGRRPSFVDAAAPDVAEPLVDRVAERLRERAITVAMGSFGAMMRVSLVNDGPVTIVVDVVDGKVV